MERKRGQRLDPLLEMKKRRRSSLLQGLDRRGDQVLHLDPDGRLGFSLILEPEKKCERGSHLTMKWRRGPGLFLERMKMRRLGYLQELEGSRDLCPS